MRLMNISALIIMVLLFQGIAVAEENVEYNNGLLVIPSVDTPEQVGRYQNVRLQLTPQGAWILQSYQEALNFTYIDDADIILTDSFPTQVFLQVSGQFIGCGGLGPINKRLVGAQFEISINEAPGPDPSEFVCTADIKPFSTIIPLPVYGLEAGIYSYKINARDLASGTAVGLTGTFELSQNNYFEINENNQVD